MPIDKLPQIPFGAVYFRKSNPPREDWARDYGIAAADGLNVFRHWFMWASIERRPGVYDWADYDRQMDLAAEHGIRTIIAELTHTVPDWAYRRFAKARQVRADGRPLTSNMGVSSATGGFASNGGGAGALSMNCPEVKEAVGAFLSALASRYKGHPALLGYDVWNEVNYAADVDYSSWMKADFRLWLRAKYGSLDALAEAWYRYSYAEWDDIEPPVEVAAYPENLDWLEFKRQNYYGQMQFKIDTIRAIDQDCLIAAHGVGGAIPNMAANGSDDWLAAEKVELYGLTWVPSRRGFSPWQNFFGPQVSKRRLPVDLPQHADARHHNFAVVRVGEIAGLDQRIGERIGVGRHDPLQRQDGAGVPLERLGALGLGHDPRADEVDHVPGDDQPPGALVGAVGRVVGQEAREGLRHLGHLAQRGQRGIRQPLAEVQIADHQDVVVTRGCAVRAERVAPGSLGLRWGSHRPSWPALRVDSSPGCCIVQPAARV